MMKKLFQIVVLAIYFISIISCIAFAESNSLQSAQADLPGKAFIWEYESLCNFKDSKNISDSKTYSQGSFSSEGCQDLEKRYGNPPAVAISLSNKSKEPLVITLPKLTDITLHTKNGKVLPAIAYRDASNFGMGLTYLFMTTMTNSIQLKVNPQKTVDLIFLFSSAKPGDKIIIPGYKPFMIEK